MKQFLNTYRTGIKLVGVTLFLMYLLSFFMVEVSKLGYLKYLEQQNYYKYLRRPVLEDNNSALFVEEVDSLNETQIVIIENLKNWEDTKFIEYEANRTGYGEQGKAVLYNQSLPNTDVEDFKRFGYNKTVSDLISVNRSVSDYRYESCKKANYSINLPSVSVICVFRDVGKSVLLRMLHSVVNRTPPEILKEIILVNDSSPTAELANLDKYVASNFPKTVKFIGSPGKNGLVACRMEAARKASGDVLIFIDPHTEVLTNWLPPLINPIKDATTIITVPRLDRINKNNFEISIMLPFRGLIDWHFDFIYTFKFDWSDEFTLYDVPIIYPSDTFAINKDFFFEMGGYDEGLILDGGENIDLSFRSWHCGGGIFEIPCSKVALFVDFTNPPKEEHVYKNYKRINEIWCGIYKEFLYARDPERYAKIDVGDLSKEIEARSRCAPFNYFIKFVAEEFPMRYPFRIDYPKFGYGIIRSLGGQQLCLDSSVHPIGLTTCDKNSTNPKIGQNFIFNYHKNLLSSHVDFCLDASKMEMSLCLYNDYAEQIWSYNLTDKQLKSNKNSQKCLTASSVNNTIHLAPCNETDPFQKWEFGSINKENIENFEKNNKYDPDLLELDYEKTFGNDSISNIIN